MTISRNFLLFAAGLTVLAGCGGSDEPAPQPAPPVVEEPAPEPKPAVAKAVLQARAGGTVAGEVTFRQTGSQVAVTAHVTGAPPGTHGFHLHEVGDCSAADFTSAGGHFNPGDMPHGAPTDGERHAGDLGNVEVLADGSTHHEVTSGLLTVTPGPNSVVGRSVILHEKADDLVTQPTGAAGSRIACGVVAAEASGY